MKTIGLIKVKPQRAEVDEGVEGSLELMNHWRRNISHFMPLMEIDRFNLVLKNEDGSYTMVLDEHLVPVLGSGYDVAVIYKGYGDTPFKKWILDEITTDELKDAVFEEITAEYHKQNGGE